MCDRLERDQRALVVCPGCAPCSLCLPPCLAGRQRPSRLTGGLEGPREVWGEDGDTSGVVWILFTLEMEDSRPLAVTTPIYTCSAIARDSVLGSRLMSPGVSSAKVWTGESSVRVARAGVVCTAQERTSESSVHVAHVGVVCTAWERTSESSVRLAHVGVVCTAREWTSESARLCIAGHHLVSCVRQSTESMSELVEYVSISLPFGRPITCDVSIANNLINSTTTGKVKHLNTKSAKLQESVNFVSAKNDDVLKQISSCLAEIASLKSEVSNLKTINQSLSEKNVFLENKINSLEKYTRRNNMEIQDMIQTPNENLEENLAMLGQAVEVELEVDDIEIAHRLPTRCANRERGLPPPVIVRFASRRKREEVMAAASSKKANNRLKVKALSACTLLCKLAKFCALPTPANTTRKTCQQE
uniref:Uncharacterized protein n=1 Tax=Timema poppense TaxID=170557 RepID=A0A7R9CIV1_TIMPO|nr:unnamed protein product [Timema poppensis]